MSEIPEYVGYANELVDKWGERLERALKETVSGMATKADLRLVEERQATVEEHWKDRHNELERDIQEERRQRLEDQAARKAAGRRLWTALGSVGGTVVIATATIIAAVLTTHH